MLSHEDEDSGDEKSSSLPLALEETSPVVVFAHGAGAPSSSEWMIRSHLSSLFLLLYFVFQFYSK